MKARSRRGRTTALLGLGVSLSVLAGCSVGPASPAQRSRPVVGGFPATGDPAVVAVVGRRTGCEQLPDTAMCTGTLVGERTVITAGHCLDRLPARGLEVYFGPRVGVPEGEWRQVKAAVVHPGYDRVDYGVDVALLELDAPAPVAPVPMLLEPLDGSHLGSEIRLVGFGESQDDAIPVGTKLEGTALLTTIDATSLVYTPSPAMTCHGDSGGPAFLTIDGTELLVGVTSRGDPSCQEYGLDIRVDPVVVDFIEPFMASTGDASSSETPLDAICSAPCESDADCPANLACMVSPGQPGTCYLPGLPPADFGEPCTAGDQCATGTCARLASSGPGACRCATSCQGIEIPPDPDDDGGCRTAPPGSSPIPALIVLAVIGRLVRRRRRS